MKQRSTAEVRSLVAVVVAVGSTWAVGQTTEYQTHLDAATLNAGSDPLFTGTLRTQWCYTAEHTGTPPELQDRAVVPPTRLFDDLWYTGLRWVGQYIINTRDGIFLIDTLNNTSEAQNITLPALQQVGMTERHPLLAAMPTHGHADHYGGAAYLQGLYGIPVYLGSADAANKPFTVTPLDTANFAPQPLQISRDKTLMLLSTPGHTPGTFSGIVPVHQDGVEYKLAYWGGTAMPGNIAAARQYLDGSERLYRLARTEGADGTMHTHAFVDGSLQHIDYIQTHGRRPNPFILGKAQTLRSLAMLRECSAAKVAQLDATAVMPVWRVTTLEFTTAAGASVAARLSSGWGPIAGQAVTFAFGRGNASCTAVTNADGVAGCATAPRLWQSRGGAVTASFEGSQRTSYLELPSEATAEVGSPTAKAQ